MYKTVKMIAWICGAIGLVLMIFGTLAALAGGILLNHNWANYFYPAYHFLVFGIFLLLALMVENKAKS